MYDRNGTILWTDRHTGKAVRSLAISEKGDLAGAVFVNEDAPSQYAYGEAVVFGRSGDELWNFTRDPTIEWIAFSGESSRVYISGTPWLYSFSRDGMMMAKNTTMARTWALESARGGSYAVAASQISGNSLEIMNEDGIISGNFTTKNGFRSVGISPDGKKIVAAGYSHLYSLDQNGTLSWEYTSSTDFTRVAVSDYGNYTAGGSQYYAWLFNRTGSIVWRYKYDGFAHDVGISDDGNHIVVGSSRGVDVFDQAGNILWNYPTPKAVTRVSISNDGVYISAGTTDTIYFFRIGGNATSLGGCCLTK